MDGEPTFFNIKDIHHGEFSITDILTMDGKTNTDELELRLKWKKTEFTYNLPEQNNQKHLLPLITLPRYCFCCF